jgi:hypothetical protein
VNYKLAVGSFQFAVLGIALVSCGSGRGTGVSNAKPLKMGFYGQDFVLSGVSGRVSQLSHTGFLLTIPKSFQPDGEEKLVLEQIKVKFPLALNSAFDWDRNGSGSRERYFAGDEELEFDWNLHGSSDRIVTVVVKGKTKPVQVENDPRVIAKVIQSSGLADTSQIAISLKRDSPQSASSFPKIEVNGDSKDSEFIQDAVKHLCAATHRRSFPVAENGFAPFGLSNSLYFGHTFWDMDVWVLPSMLFLQPDAVRSMNRYRLDRAGQAEKNAAEFFKKPNSGMMFPWESSVTGKETVRASSVKEHHISGSVLWGLNLSEKAGIAPPPEVGKVARGVARFFENRSITGVSGREIKDVMSPDENHIGDNDLYTNLLAQWVMNGRKWDGPTKFKLPKDAKSFLTYDNDKERGYKQAAAVLSIFPLQYPLAEKQAGVMMERFESKVSKNGPAMSDAIHATIWARLGEREKAYDAWKRSWEPFVKGPQMLFSEKRSSERTYFYTGAAGCLNTVIYGFAGFRFDDKPLDGAVWEKKLKSGWWLSCKPCLPPKWESLMINPMIIDGQKYGVEITPEKVTIQPTSGS